MLAIALAISLSLAPAVAAPTPSASKTGAPTQPKSASAAKPYRGWRHFGHWQLYVGGDPFADQTSCVVSSSGMHYDHDVLTLLFGPRAETLDAIYRIDDGPPVKASSNDRALSSRGFYAYLDEITDAGAIRVPGEQVAGAREVRVELKRSGHVVTRRLDGLDAAVAAARQYRCAGFGRGPD